MRYAFSDCILDTDDQTLTRKGVSVPVEPQVFELLHLLIGQAGKLVSRDQIIDAVWNGRIVSDSAVSARIAAARKAVGDDGKAQKVIQTVSRRGLRFVASLEQAKDAPRSGSIAPRPEYDIPPGHALHARPTAQPLPIPSQARARRCFWFPIFHLT